MSASTHLENAPERAPGAEPGGAFRSLWSWEADLYYEHLKRLGREDRRLRFHRAMSDDGLRLHVDRAFEHDKKPNGLVHVIGWFLDAELRGAAEVAVYETPDGPEAEAAFAVEEDYRGQGVGRELMRRSALYARNRGAGVLHIATERDNRAMLKLAMGSGAVFEISAADADGVLRTEPRSVFSLLLETAEEDLGVAHWAWDRALGWLRRRWTGQRGIADGVAAAVKNGQGRAA
ncbi:MAG: GNAT family N-acetyltransferase [Pseudomonadota bacterium]